MPEKPIIKCKICNDTGKVKYKKVEWAMYSWQPWLTRDCICKKAKKNCYERK